LFLAVWHFCSGVAAFDPVALASITTTINMARVPRGPRPSSSPLKNPEFRQAGTTT
jgi:hypothetical protein